jgi:hypothetical protein
MSNKVKLRNKRLRLEYRFKKAELEEVEEKNTDYASEFREFFAHEMRLLNPEPQISSDVPNEEDIHIEPELTDEELKSHNQSKGMKTLYRKIIEKTHPDKIGNEDHREEFQQATEAYKDNNAAELINIADDLGLETPELDEETIEGYKKGIDIVSNKVKHTTDTFSWVWGEADTEEKKQQLKSVFYVYWGITEEQVAKYKQDNKGE